MADDDPQPTDPFAPKEKGGMDRRRFVKVAMGAAALGAVGAASAGIVVPLSTSGGLNIRRFPYIGAKKIGGPAPQGIPLIPLKVNKDGFVEGVPELKDSPFEHNLEWYRYCGHDNSPAFDPGFTDDNILRYYNNPVKVETAESELGHEIWYKAKLDQPILARDFNEVDQGAPFRWRSEELTGNDIVTGIIIKVDPDDVGGNYGEDAASFMASSNPDEPDKKDLIAFCSYCAHFCCVPGYKESKIPLKRDYFDEIYCTCHDSVYDPRNIAKYTFPPNL